MMESFDINHLASN